MPETIYTDGSGWNGMTSAYCIARTPEDKYVHITEENKTSNEMEYQAIIKALQNATEGATIITDSRLATEQINQNWLVRAENLKELHKQARQLLTQKKATIKWTPRDKNIAGIILEKYTKRRNR